MNLFITKPAPYSLDRNIPIIIYTLSALTIAVGIFAAACNRNESPVSIEPPISMQRLTGRWLRPDGGYILEVRRIHSDGKVEAGYLNPRPIHVAEAKAEITDNRLRLRVVMQDRGYPGSYYELDYQPQQDQLVGNYYQASMGAVYEVQFVRLAE